MAEAGKFQVSVERVVNLGNYESLRVGLAETLDLDTEKPDDAYGRILRKVEGWTKELKPAKPDTGVAKTSEATQPTLRADDPYLTLPWKQSQKRANLGTIRITPEALANPLIHELYDRVREVKTMRVLGVTYRYSKMPDGAEFLQKWASANTG